MEQKASKSLEIAIACVGCALIAAAVAADQAWFDRHFLPSFWKAREDIVRDQRLIRIGIAIAGAFIVFVLRRPFARTLAKERLYLITIPIAILLAIATSEAMLRKRPRRHFE